MRRLTLVLALYAPLVFTSLASAQTYSPALPQVETAVVGMPAPIFLYPDDKRIPVRVASENTVLQVLDVAGEWYHVKFEDPDYGPRVGYVQKKYLKTPDLRPMDLSIRSAALPQNPASTSTAQVAAPAVRPADVSGEPAPLRRPGGFWFNIGLGVGSLGCEECLNRVTGPSGGLSLGGAVSDKVWLGFGSTGWSKLIDDERLSVGTADFRIRVYPAHRSGFYITAGLGIGSIQLPDVSEFGAGAVVGVGWDIPVSRRVSLTPYYNGFAMKSDLDNANVAQVGIGITIH